MCPIDSQPGSGRGGWRLSGVWSSRMAVRNDTPAAAEEPGSEAFRVQVLKRSEARGPDGAEGVNRRERKERKEEKGRTSG